jgi:hypothetical protein
MANLWLKSGGGRVRHSFDLVGSLLGHRFLRVRLRTVSDLNLRSEEINPDLQRRSSLVGHRLTSSVRHDDDDDDVGCMSVKRCYERRWGSSKFLYLSNCMEVTQV